MDVNEIKAMAEKILRNSSQEPQITDVFAPGHVLKHFGAGDNLDPDTAYHLSKDGVRTLADSCYNALTPAEKLRAHGGEKS